MAAGTQTYNGIGLPIYGEATITGQVAATDTLTIKQPASASGASLSVVDSSDTHRFAITAKGGFRPRLFTTRPTTGLVKGEMILLIHTSTPKIGICTSTGAQTIKLRSLRTKTFGRLTA